MNIIKKLYKKVLNFSIRIAKKVLRYKENVYTKEKLIKKLIKYQVISFDIFDTLITRKIFNPDDIFMLMEERMDNIVLKDRMLKMRKFSEQRAREIYNKDVNIDEIYDLMGRIYGYSDDECEKLKQLEINLELELTYPRKDMIDILKLLMDSGKKVILTSDMYLPKDVIIKMLEKCGYNEGVHYKRIYISNDKNMRKDDTSLWKYIKVLYLGMKFIHVGDNIHSDYNIPSQLGLNAIYIDNPREQLRKSVICDDINKCIEERSISDSLFLGYLFNTIVYNSPFNKDISSLEMFSKVAIAPIITDFIGFINKSIDKEDTLLFLAREGYYLEKIYKDYCYIFNKNENKHHYFLASRKALLSSTICDENDIKNIIKRDYNGTIKSFIKSVFDIEYHGEDFRIVLPNDCNKVMDIVLNYKDELIIKSREYKDSYLKYINSIINLDKERIALVDLGYSGTIQFHLSRMVNKDLNGLYLTNSDNVKKYSKKSSLLFNFDIESNKWYEELYHNSLVLEYFLSAPFGQLQYFVEDGKKVKPVYNNEIMDDRKKAVINNIYNYTVDYMRDINEINKIYNLNINKDLIAKLYISIINNSFIAKNIKDEFIFIDSYSSSIPRNVFKIINKY